MMSDVWHTVEYVLMVYEFVVLYLIQFLLIAMACLVVGAAFNHKWAWRIGTKLIGKERLEKIVNVITDRCSDDTDQEEVDR